MASMKHLVTGSRFDVLGEAESKSQRKPNSSAPARPAKSSESSSNRKPKLPPNKVDSAKRKPKQLSELDRIRAAEREARKKKEKRELRNAAFGISKQPKTKSKADQVSKVSSSNASKTKTTDDDFLIKYKEAENQDFKNNLEEAILQSKIDYEEKRDHYDRMRKHSEEQAKVAATATNTKKRIKSTTAIDELQKFHVPEATPVNDSAITGKGKVKNKAKLSQQPSTNSLVNGADFVENVDSNAKKVGSAGDKVENTEKKKVKLRKDRDPEALLLLCRADLEEKENKIQQLVAENGLLKNEMSDLRKMNDKFCSILDKVKTRVDAVSQVEELIKDKDELTQEIATLCENLEQERSKVHKLQLELLKAQASRKKSK